MIYLDNAATTWPKPLAVRNAVSRALVSYGANPGRGGHRMAMETAKKVYACRETAAELFGLDDPVRVIFTSNCTMGLNMVIKGVLSNGGHAVISDMEHNSVVRPLEALAKYGVTYDLAKVCEFDNAQTVRNFKQCIRHNTRLILCTHASNVFGNVLPIREIGELAHQANILFAVDAAQSAGLLPINMKRDNIDFLCMPGHKGLYGPMGTGMLLCQNAYPLHTLLEGGTGSRSLEILQPDELPDRLESGTVNVPGICGLHAGMLWVKQCGVSALAQQESELMQRFYCRVKNLSFLTLYTNEKLLKESVPLVSLNVQRKESEEIAELLSEEGIAVRAGLHCAPAAHRHRNTLPNGTVRIAPSAFTTSVDMENLCKILIKISRKP